MTDVIHELKASDFEQLNFGIVIAEKYGHKFIYQLPFCFDNKRAAQTGPVLFINSTRMDVKDGAEALSKCNEFLRGESMTFEITLDASDLEHVSVHADATSYTIEFASGRLTIPSEYFFEFLEIIGKNVKVKWVDLEAD